jgi:putative transposase
VTKFQDLTGLAEARRQEAMERFAILRPHLEGGTPLPEAAAAAGIPLRTAERWLARYRAEGISGLARRNPSSHRDGRFPDQLATFVEGLFLRRPPPSIANVHRTACEVAGKKSWPEPSHMGSSQDKALIALG